MTMTPIADELATPGRIIAARDGVAVFAPRDTRYELHLAVSDGQPVAPLNARLEAVVHVKARQIWTVSSGGNWIAPIVGTPRIIQGRVRRIDGNQLTIQAGATFIVEMPNNDSAIDLPSGQIAVGRIVNVVALPGASIEIIGRGDLSERV